MQCDKKVWNLGGLVLTLAQCPHAPTPILSMGPHHLHTCLSPGAKQWVYLSDSVPFEDHPEFTVDTQTLYLKLWAAERPMIKLHGMCTERCQSAPWSVWD